MAEQVVHTREAEGETHTHIRSDDALIARWARKLWPVLLLVLGLLWREAAAAVMSIPDKSQMEEIQRSIEERPALLIEFRTLQNDFSLFKAEVTEDRSLSTAQRAEVLNRLGKMDDKIDRMTAILLRQVGGR